MFFDTSKPIETYDEIIRRLHHKYGEELKLKIDTISKENKDLSNKLKTMSIESNVQQKLLNNLYKSFNDFAIKQNNTCNSQNSDNLYTIVAHLKNGSTITYSTDEFTLIEDIKKWWRGETKNISIQYSMSANHNYSYNLYHFSLDSIIFSRSDILSLDIKVA